MNTLYYDIFENICSNLNIKDLISLSQTNKYLHYTLDSNFYWKRRLLVDYNFSLYNHTTRYKYPKKYIDYKLLYIKYYNNNCIECFKKTKHHNYFYNIIICSVCEGNNPIYDTLYRKDVLSLYFIPKHVLDNSNIKTITKYNFYNSNRPFRIYLKNDILNLAYSYYGGSSGYYKFYLKKRSEISGRIFNSYIAQRIFTISLYSMYGINLFTLLPFINKYTNGSYHKFLCSKNNKNLNKIINACIELDFIFKYTNTSYKLWKGRFNDSLLDYLISNYIITFNLNEYIMNIIYSLMRTNKDIFIRRNNILLAFQDIYSIPNSILHNIDIYYYIKYNIGSLDKLILKYKIC